MLIIDVPQRWKAIMYGTEYEWSNHTDLTTIMEQGLLWGVSDEISYVSPTERVGRYFNTRRYFLDLGISNLDK